MSPRIFLIAFLFIWFLSGLLSVRTEATEPTFNRPLPAVKLPTGTNAPTIDGDLSDPIWQHSAARAALFYDPQSGRPVNDQTEAWLVYDEHYIYAAFHCHDSRPDAIIARETVRDAGLWNDDNVRLELDPFLTYKWNDCAVFTVNPRGTQNTRLVGGRADKLEWQGDWSVATRRVADGWTAEMRIPWAILSYPRLAGPATMGINFHRYQARTQITSIWSDVGPQGFNEREGLWKGVEAPRQTWKPRLSFLPYLMPSGYGGGGTSQFRSGLDIRYQPTPELTGVATLNPDFASVEGAVQSIGFTRGERYVPERRPFFREGRDYFGVGEDYELGLLFDPTTITQVDAGAKLYGKLTPKTTMGLLSTVAAGQQANFVTQLRREFSPTSSAHLMLLQHLAPGEDNTVVAFAPQFRRGKWSVDGQAIQTMGPGAGGFGWTTALNLEDKVLFSTIRYRHVAENFNDRLGYVPFTDYRGWSSYTHWGSDWRRGFWRNFGVDFSPTWDWHTDGRPFRRRAGINFGFETRSDYRIGFNVDGGKFDNDTDFTYGVSLGGGVTNRFAQWGLDFTTGQLANQPFTSFGPSFRVRVFKRLDVGFTSYVQNYGDVTYQHIVTFNYEINPYRAWGGRAVIENGLVNVYLSYHNAGRGGTDTYFIIGDPNASTFVKRVMMKFVFAL